MNAPKRREISPEIQENAKRLADFILFTQRSVILNLSTEFKNERISFSQFPLLAYLASNDSLIM